ncbi:unnamed protein product [Amaranthus hypochondriacus]
MGMNKYFHMSKGEGELSYSRNSSLQETVWLLNKQLLEGVLESLFKVSYGNGKVCNIVDLGCGVGPVPPALVSLVINVIKGKLKEYESCDEVGFKCQIYMNDLPSNDFSTLFKDLMSLEGLQTKYDGNPLCFLMGAPGSYYDRLFHPNTLDFVHANYALHWLSQVPAGLWNEQGMPMNKGDIYMSETSSKAVGNVYWTQFENDFTKFLKHRSEEVVPNGYMLITLLGRPNDSNFFTWRNVEHKIITQSLIALISEGLVKEEKLDDFNFPAYHPSMDQLESVVKKEGSFFIEEKRTSIHDPTSEIKSKHEKAQILAKSTYAFSGSLISHHFGDQIVQPFYDKLVYFAFQHFDLGYPAPNHSLTILLRKF